MDLESITPVGIRTESLRMIYASPLRSAERNQRDDARSGGPLFLGGLIVFDVLFIVLGLRQFRRKALT